MRKILILRTSSFGDIIQSFEVAAQLKKAYPQSHITWLLREEFQELTLFSDYIDEFIFVKKGNLIQTLKTLSEKRWSLIYDAHRNLRSLIITAYLRLRQPFSPQVYMPSFTFKKILTFTLKTQNFFTNYQPSKEFLKPLSKWINLSEPKAHLPKKLIQNKMKTVEKFSCDTKKFWVLAPQAAWDIKTWPESHWISLTKALPTYNFILLGGHTYDSDHPFNQLPNLKNLCGQTSWRETAHLILHSEGAICNDSGILHLADYLGHKVIGLLGPTGLGQPCRENSHILSSNLPCQPCTRYGRGKCSQKIYKKCLISLSPQVVIQKIKEITQ